MGSSGVGVATAGTSRVVTTGTGDSATGARVGDASGAGASATGVSTAGASAAGAVGTSKPPAMSDDVPLARVLLVSTEGEGLVMFAESA